LLADVDFFILFPNCDWKAKGRLVYQFSDSLVPNVDPHIRWERRGDLAMVQEAVQRAVRSAINEAWGKKPVVKVLLSVVETRG